MIRQSIRLNFDPENASPEIQKVFADELARTLWLAIKQGHMTDQNFCKSLLRQAAAIRKIKEKGKMDSEMLFRILSGFARFPTRGVIGTQEQAFAKELLPFVMGEKTITFEIKRC